MIDLGKYMYAELLIRGAKTNIYGIYSRSFDDLLGKIQWYGPWRQYCFMPTPGQDLVFNHSCLAEIEQFLKKLNAEHRQKRGQG